MGEILGTVRAMSSAAMPGRLSGPQAWVGSHVGDIVLEVGDETRTIQAFVPKDLARIQYVGLLASEAATVARASTGTTHVAQAALKDGRTGAWHVSGLVDQHGSPIAFDKQGALKQGWHDASLNIRHEDLGGVYGEATEFPVKDEMLAAMIETPRVGRLDLPLVHTGEAKLALAAAQQGTTTNLAEIVGRAGSRAKEGIAELRPLTSPPAAVAKSAVIIQSGYNHSATELHIDVSKAVTVDGPIEVADRASRRLSLSLDGQDIGVFKNGSDSWIVAPLTVRNGQRPTYQRPNSHHIDAYGDMKWGKPRPSYGVLPKEGYAIPELQRVVTPTLIRQPSGGFVELLEPAAVKRALTEQPIDGRIRELTERHATVSADLANANWFTRKGLERTERELGATLSSLRQERQDAVDGVLTKFGPRLLSETEEWAARGLGQQMHGLTEAPKGTEYDDLVNQAVAASQSSDEVGTVVLRGIDGALWTAKVSIEPHQLLGAYPNLFRFSESVLAISVGGRTLQWDAAGKAALN